MSDFLLEFFSEEIPARMQARAEADLERLFTQRMKEAGLSWSGLETFSGPRRIGLVMSGLPEKTEDVREERKGPRTDAPEKAIEGFLRGAGLSSVDQCKIEQGKKGAFYVAVIEKPGRATAAVIAEAIEEVAKAFPWPKSMKFGEGATSQRWVRPLQRILALLGGEIVETAVFGIKASNVTEGHRIHGDGPFEVSGWDDYCAKLKANGVILMRSERRAKILLDARKVCADAGLKLVEDDGLLDEVTGLVEHPHAILGDMDPAFLDLPPEVIQLTMKTHQKYFAVEDADGKITSKFVVIANQDAPDGGTAIAEGNSRVLSARLSDARHFWDLDRAKGLEAMAGELSKVTFHEKLGTVADKVERVATLAKELAPAVGAEPELAYIAAKLAKADLVSQMVYEFPELQGVMGRYYALSPASKEGEFPAKSRTGSGAQSRDLSQDKAPESAQGPGSAPEQGSGLSGNSGMLEGLNDEQRRAVADAIRDHYKPQGPSDAVPTAPVSAAVALADKLDTLVGFWAIDEKPTGSKDPFALRRAALGVIRVLLEGGLRLRLGYATSNTKSVDHLLEKFRGDPAGFAEQTSLNRDLLAFFADRLKVHLRDEGVRHDVIDAVFALGDDDLVRVTKKSRALQGFVETDDGAALLAGYRRAANILAAEEKKGFNVIGAGSEALKEVPDPDGDWSEEAHKAALLIAIAKTADAPEERVLISEIQAAEEVAGKALADEDFEAAMAALSKLRGPVDAFFEAVVVNAEDRIVRRNRLLLLSRIRAAVDAVADFSRLEG